MDQTNQTTQEDHAMEMAALNRKLDALTAHVTYLTEQAQAAERAGQSRAELIQDMMPAVNGAFRIAVDQLEELQEYTDLNDLLRLLKQLLRNGRNIERMLDQLESISDLASTAMPLSSDAFDKVTEALAAMERKGYFAAARGGLRIVDNIVTSFSEDDVRQLGDNIVLILRTVKEMTQPEVMNFLRSTVTLAEHEAEQPVDISYRALLLQMRDPNVRRGLALSLRMLSGIGAQATSPSPNQ